jgi:iron transport multicopper oxidase
MYPHVKKQADSQFTVNGVPYDSPTVPVLLQILNGANVSELVPAGNIYGLEANKSVELTIPMTAAAVGGPVSVHDCG